MNIEELIGLGLTKNEAKTYLSLIKFGKASANELIRHTKMHKKLVYENIEKLIDKGLVTFIIQDHKKIFHIASPDMLVELFEEKIKETEKTKEKAEKIAKEIKTLSKQTLEKQEATIYRGVKGVKTFYRELIEIGEDMYTFGGPKESVGIMGETFWINLDKKRADINLVAKMIFNESLREWSKLIKDKVTKVKFFEENFEPLTETTIQTDRVAFIVWTEEPLLFLIKNKIVADNYKKFFNDLWKRAKS